MTANADYVAPVLSGFNESVKYPLTPFRLLISVNTDSHPNNAQKRVFRGSGILGKFGYHWIAGHRNSSVVRILTILLEKVNTFN
jgi:hypothetical protein